MQHNEEKTVQLEQLQEQILVKKKELVALNEEKERWFEKRAQIGNTIAEHIREVKEKRTQRDKLTAEVQQRKKERKDYSQDIRDKITEVKKLRKQREDYLAKVGIKNAPKGLKKTIEKMEMVLQTEPMPYSKEQQYTKKLNELKEIHKKTRDVENLSKQIRSISKEIDLLKKESDEVHETLQGSADTSQNYHEEVIETSKYIDDLKAQEDEAYAAFSEKKDLYIKKREELQVIIDQADKLREELGIRTSTGKQVITKQVKAELKKKSDEVEQKVKNKQKLTTEDLLAFQASE